MASTPSAIGSNVYEFILFAFSFYVCGYCRFIFTFQFMHIYDDRISLTIFLFCLWFFSFHYVVRYYGWLCGDRRHSKNSGKSQGTHTQSHTISLSSCAKCKIGNLQISSVLNNFLSTLIFFTLHRPPIVIFTKFMLANYAFQV